MYKKTISFFILLIGSIAIAQQNCADSNETVNQSALKIAAASPGFYSKEEAQDISTVKVIYTQPNCNSFLHNGIVGKYGKKVIEYIDKNPKAYFDTTPNDFVSGLKLCPEFPNMTRAQKRLFWVWTFRSLAHTESSCRPAPPVDIKAADTDTKNPSAAADRGMLQLNYNRCGEIDLNDALNSISCGVNLLAKELNERGRLTSRQTSSDKKHGVKAEVTYWGPLRADGKNKNRSSGSIRNSERTQATISKFKYCKAPTNEKNEEKDSEKYEDEVVVKTKAIAPPVVKQVDTKNGTYKIVKPGVVKIIESKTRRKDKK